MSVAMPGNANACLGTHSVDIDSLPALVADGPEAFAQEVMQLTRKVRFPR